MRRKIRSGNFEAGSGFTRFRGRTGTELRVRLIRGDLSLGRHVDSFYESGFVGIRTGFMMGL